MPQKEITKMYDLLGRLNSPIHHIGGLEATQMLLENLPINGNSKVLDVGSGTGYTACGIAKKYGAQLTGIDLPRANRWY